MNTHLDPPDNPLPVARSAPLTLVGKLLRSLQKEEDWMYVNNFTAEFNGALLHTNRKLIIGASGTVYGEDRQVSFVPRFWEKFQLIRQVRKIINKQSHRALNDYSLEREKDLNKILDTI